MLESPFSLLLIDETDSEHAVKTKHTLGLLNDDNIAKPSKALTSSSMIYVMSSPTTHAYKPFQAGVILEFILKFSNMVLNVNV